MVICITHSAPILENKLHVTEKLIELNDVHRGEKHREDKNKRGGVFYVEKDPE